MNYEGDEIPPTPPFHKGGTRTKNKLPRFAQSFSFQKGETKTDCQATLAKEINVIARSETTWRSIFQIFQRL